MKAVITVIGNDKVGIIAKVSAECSECGANIVDITQTVLRDYFAMIMLVETDSLKMSFSDFVDRLDALGKREGLEVHTVHEDVINTMHHI